MPVRAFRREQQWLLPPSLDDVLEPDHPARFVAAFIDAIDAEAWTEMGIVLSGDPEGAPAYDARALLGVWALGFMTGVRSSRKLEAACHEQIPYLWLTGFQQPDHNTLWRFYQQHREGMRALLKRSVRTAVAIGLVDLALQAVDGTRVRGNVALERTLDAAGLERLLRRTDVRIAELESQQTASDDPSLPRLPDQQQAAFRRPYHKEQFAHDRARDTYTPVRQARHSASTARRATETAGRCDTTGRRAASALLARRLDLVPATSAGGRSGRGRMTRR